MTNSEAILQAVTLVIARMAGDLDRDLSLHGIQFDVRLNPQTQRPAEVSVSRRNIEELPGAQRVGHGRRVHA